MQAFGIAVTGISVVFVFLSLLVVLLVCLGQFISRFNHAVPEPQDQPKKPTHQPIIKQVAAAAVAVHRHRKK